MYENSKSPGCRRLARPLCWKPGCPTPANPAEITAAVPFALAETAAGPPFSTNCGADQVCAWTELEQTNMPPAMKAFTTNKRQMRFRMDRSLHDWRIGQP